MSIERKITREVAEAAADQIKLAVASGEEQVTIELAGIDLILEKDPESEGGYTIRAPGDSMRARLIAAQQTLPTGYPANMPFVPGESVSVTESEPNTLSMVWWGATDPEHVLRSLDQQSISAGWVLLEETQLTNMRVLQRSYAKPGFERLVMATGGTVTLIQTTAPQGDVR